MRIKVKHIIKVILMFSLIMCWGISVGYSNNIKSDNKVVNFYFENDEVTTKKIDELTESRKDLMFAGWMEEGIQTISNPDLNRNVENLKILFIKGSSSLLINSSMLFQDDIDGCLIDEDTAYKLFGSIHGIGQNIEYNGRNLVVRGIHKETKANVIMQPLDKDIIILDGITMDVKDLNLSEIDEFKMQSGFKEFSISGGVYYYIAKFASLLFPVGALILILIKVTVQAIKIRQKPVLLAIYIIISLAIIFIFFKITNINIKIPLDLIPNKWSDFDFWTRLWKEYIDKFKYILYMKKNGVDIYNIENLAMSVLYSILTIVLFIINLKVIKIKVIKELIIVMGILIVSTFITVLLVYSKYGFDINIAMIWLIYPLYLGAEYFLKSLIKEEKLLTSAGDIYLKAQQEEIISTSI